MIVKAASLLATIYGPTMWALVAVYVLLGITGLVSPERLRGLVRVFTRSGPVRVLGVILLIVGTEMFLRAPGAVEAFRVTALKVVGIALFVDGGVCLFVPTMNVIIAERCASWARHWYRLFGLLSFGIAYLFYLATRLPVPPNLLKHLSG